MKNIIIKLPFPDAKLFPNRSHGEHWSKTSGLRKKARQDAFYLTKEQVGTKTLGPGEHALTITFAQSDNRSRDRDNTLAAAKPYLDGLSDALKVNDNQYEPVTIRREYGAEENHMLIFIHERDVC